MISIAHVARRCHAATVLFLLAGGCAEKQIAQVASEPATRSAAPASVLFPDVDRYERIVLIADPVSMHSTLAVLKFEMNKVVASLRPDQSFNLIFFGEAKADFCSPVLLRASTENKHKAMHFLDFQGTGMTTDGMPALELAFKQKPDVIYLVADGEFPDNDAMLTKIRKLNAAQKVTVHAIAYIHKDDTSAEFIALFKQIARENRGEYRRVDPDDL